MIADGPTAGAALATLAERRPVIYNAHNLESGFRHELQHRYSYESRATQAPLVRDRPTAALQRIVDGQRGRHAWRARAVP